MAGKGPPPTPTSILKVRGSTLVKGRAGEPEVKVLDFEAMKPPAYLSPEAVAVWNRLVPPIARMRVLAESDIEGLALLCDLRAEYLALGRGDAKLKKELGTAIKGWIEQYAGTPSARARVKVTDHKKPEAAKSFGGLKVAK